MRPHAGNVTVAVEYSTVNYRDGLALTGRAPILRSFPLIPGIDLSGTVEASSHPDIKAGDKVVANGWGLGQTHHGGYALSSAAIGWSRFRRRSRRGMLWRLERTSPALNVAEALTSTPTSLPAWMIISHKLVDLLPCDARRVSAKFYPELT